MKRGLLSQPQRIGERIASRNLLNINHPLAESSPVARIPISMIPGVGGIASGYMQEDLATLQQPEETFFNIPSSVYGIRDPRYFPLPGGANITNHDLARFGLATDAMDWIPGAAAVGSMATGAGLLGRWLKGNETPDSDAVSLWDAISPAMVDPRTGLLSMTNESRLLPDELPMDTASRMQRAKEMGFDTDVYHGTTHDIDAFDTAKANPESDWGPATYTTTSLDDVNPNYAGEGPDLTNRITQLQEQIADNNNWPSGDTRALELARAELVGSKGAIYPLKVNTEKYAVVGGDNPTYIETPDYREEAISEINRTDFDSLDEYEDAVSEYAWELESSDVNHPIIEIKDALMQVAGDTDEEGVNNAIAEISESFYDGMTATRLDEIIRKNVLDVWGGEGEFLGAGAASAKVFEKLGFEGVIDKTVDTKFGSSRKFGKSMEGVDPDTTHIITFPGFEKNIRSKSAKFDPKKINDSDLLSGRGLLHVGRAV